MLNAVLFIICVLIWGSTWYAIKFQFGIVPIEWSVAYRFFLAAILLLGWCIISRRRLRFSWSDHAVFAGLGALLFCLNYVLLYWGTSYLTSGLVAVIFSMMSLANQVNGALLLRIRIEPKVLVGALCGLSGLGLIFAPEFSKISGNDGLVTGIVLCLLGTLSASFGNTLAATERGKNFPLFAFNGYAMLYGSALMALYAVLTGTPPALDLGVGYVVSFLYLTVFGTVAGFTIYLTLLKTWGLGRTAYVAIAIPLVALAVSTIFENYQWTPLAVAGVGLVLVGNLMLIRKKRPALMATDSLSNPEKPVV